MTNRRFFLRAIGACLALPTLESIPGASAKVIRSKTPGAAKPRLAYLYFPNGSASGSWKPRKVGKGSKLQQLNGWMSPLEDFKSDIQITKNIWTPRGNGHSAGTATWLTGGSFNNRKNDAGGLSVDQILAQTIGQDSPLPSLEMSTEGEGYFSGSLPRNSISWTRSNIPAARETRPRDIFDKLFRRSSEGFVDKSVVDLVLGQSKFLKKGASLADQMKIDEYLEAIRAIEKRLEFADSKTDLLREDGQLTETLTRPKPGIPSDHKEYVRQMLDLIALAFWSGSTRISSFMLDHGQSNRYFNFVPGVKGTWHALSHWKDASGNTEDDDGITSWDSVDSKKDMYNAVTRWHHEQVAYFLGKLKSLKDPDGSPVLDRTMVVYGSSLADGNEHGERDLPTILAGGSNGLLTPGRYLAFDKDTSMSKLHLSLMHKMGSTAEKFAETNATLTEI